MTGEIPADPLQHRQTTHLQEVRDAWHPHSPVNQRPPPGTFRPPLHQLSDDERARHREGHDRHKALLHSVEQLPGLANHFETVLEEHHAKQEHLQRVIQAGEKDQMPGRISANNTPMHVSMFPEHFGHTNQERSKEAWAEMAGKVPLVQGVWGADIQDKGIGHQAGMERPLQPQVQRTNFRIFAPVDAPLPYRPGDHVFVMGLEEAHRLNGRIGTIREWNEDEQKWLVAINPLIHIPNQNLQPTEPRYRSRPNQWANIPTHIPELIHGEYCATRYRDGAKLAPTNVWEQPVQKEWVNSYVYYPEERSSIDCMFLDRFVEDPHRPGEWIDAARAQRVCDYYTREAEKEHAAREAELEELEQVSKEQGGLCMSWIEGLRRLNNRIEDCYKLGQFPEEEILYFQDWRDDLIKAMGETLSAKYVQKMGEFGPGMEWSNPYNGQRLFKEGKKFYTSEELRKHWVLEKRHNRLADTLPSNDKLHATGMGWDNDNLRMPNPFSPLVLEREKKQVSQDAYDWFDYRNKLIENTGSYEIMEFPSKFVDAELYRPQFFGR